MNKKIISICLIILLFVIFFLLYYVKSSVKVDGIIKFTAKSVSVDNGYLFKSNAELSDKIKSYSSKTKLDFNNHNYVLLTIYYDECSETDLNIDNYKIIGDDKIIVNISYTSKCGVCAGDYLYYLLEVDKSIENIDLDVKYNAKNAPHCDPNVAYKPLIYLYPDKEMDVSVKLGNPSYITSVYPKYNDGWNVTARVDGTMIDKNTGRNLYGLYWEGCNHYSRVEKDGFVVKGEDTLEFLEEKLAILGLNEYESEEFIIYWLPKMENNKYNYIRFETFDEINEYMSLDIEPKPDSIIRVLMDFKPLDKSIDVVEQKLETPVRNGFTVVEWGGSIIE